MAAATELANAKRDWRGAFRAVNALLADPSDTVQVFRVMAALNAAGDPAGARSELAEFEAGPGQRLLDLRGGNGWELLIRTLLSLGELDAAAEAAATADARARTSLLPQRAATAMWPKNWSRWWLPRPPADGDRSSCRTQAPSSRESSFAATGSAKAWSTGSPRRNFAA